MELVFSNLFSVAGSLPWLIILVAAVVAFVVGIIWYSIFGKVWMSLTGKGKKSMTKGLMLTKFVYLIILSYLIALITFTTDAATYWLLLDALVGILVFIRLEQHMCFAQKGKALKLFLIDSGYAILAVAVIAVTFFVF